MVIKLLKFLFERSRLVKWSPPTKAQIKYLNRLIEINNTYRAKPLTLQDWINSRYKGSLYLWSAGRLIEHIKAENIEKRKLFRKRKNDRLDRKDQNILYASDFSAFGFCPNAFYLVHRGYANRNLYELEGGKLFHGEYSFSEGYTNQTVEYLKNSLDKIKNIKLFKSSDYESFYDAELGISGLPDGVISFNNESRAIIEIKSRNASIPQRPYFGDIMQACAYREIYKKKHELDSYQLSNDLIILYVNRKTKERKHFEVNFMQHRSAFKSALEAMKKISYAKEQYKSEQNKNKCPTCGYRWVCQKFSAG